VLAAAGRVTPPAGRAGGVPPPARERGMVGYGGTWRQVTVADTTWRWPGGIAFIIAALALPPLLVIGGPWLFAHGTATAETTIGAVLAAVATLTGAWLARRAVIPGFTEFDGQVIKQWVRDTEENGP